jgi:predicted MFS family arabinose efflux permease
MQHANAAGPRPVRATSAFITLAVATVTITAAASAPSPIYPLYRERWHFSVTLLTVVFAVYVVGLLAALLTVGSLSDYIGRRPVLVAAFTVAAASTAIFWTAEGSGALIAARLIQGMASGTAMSGLAAGLLDFAPRSRPHLGTTTTAVGTSVGMATGAAVVGLLAAKTSHPDGVVFPVLTLMFLALALTSLLLPETATPRGVTLVAFRPTIRVSSQARSQFVATLPTTIAGWAATGLFLALAPSLVRDVLHLHFKAAGGLAIAVLYLAVTIGGVWSLRQRARTATILGASLMTAGAVSLALGLATGSLVEFTAAALAIGLGVGLTFNGNLRAMSAVTSATTRSETFAAIYVVSYASLSVPTLAAGILVPFSGLRATGCAFVAFVGILSAIAVVHAILLPGQVSVRPAHRNHSRPVPSPCSAE